jgi:hypothetical protein
LAPPEYLPALEPFLGREGGDAATFMHALAGEDFNQEAQVIRIQVVPCVKATHKRMDS